MREKSHSQLTKREKEVVRELLEGGRVATVAKLFGISPRTVSNHLKSSFQKLGVHSQAELIELARSNAYFGAWALSTDAAELPVAAATARVAAIEAYNFAAKENVQVHGGMGFTWEFNCHLYYRRARQLALVIGSQRRWKDRLIHALERRNAA